MAALWEQLDEYTKLNVDNATGTMKVCGHLYLVFLSVIFSIIILCWSSIVTSGTLLQMY